MWQGKLADPEIPVRMPSPLHFKFIGKVERQFRLLANKFIDNGAVIDAAYGSTSSIVLIEQIAADLVNIGDRNRLDPQHLLRHQKVGKSFLMLRINFHQNDTLRSVLSDNRPVQELLVTLPVEAAKEVRQFRIKSEYIKVGLRQNCLIRIEGRERLQLN